MCVCLRGIPNIHDLHNSFKFLLADVCCYTFFASSFSPVVLLLKVVMAQQGLDKPFTGGLGSYKLYVLVAYHVSMEFDYVSLQFCGRIPWIVLPLLTRNHSFLLNPKCSQIECHLANGGNDRPSEILLRY